MDELNHTKIEISHEWAEQQTREMLALHFLQGRVALDDAGMQFYRHHKENSAEDKLCRQALVEIIKNSDLPANIRLFLALMFSPDGDPGTDFKDGTARSKKLVVKNRHRGAEQNVFRQMRISASVKRAEAEGKGTEATVNALMEEYGFYKVVKETRGHE
ncbi:hypothetical protein [Tardiphaga robiniae]|uniref:Uncharacterized protein n=1 Tax=Tardiphaga robiniae TaxID=943830 RepID=A0A7G6U311_9BRAD|nr:hypothetical protein [Tardiphaga robiniae]QND73393.1 hypothetical protein HB776_20920 [Tardiphaga robiniae]